MDVLSSVLRHFSLNANVFFSGNMCGTSDFSDDKGVGHLHLLRSGTLKVRSNSGFEVVLSTPSVIFFPHSTGHCLFSDKSDGADLVCAQISYQSGGHSPLLQALPFCLNYELTGDGLLDQSAFWIFEEAFKDASGKDLIIDRLCDVFLISVLRKVLEEGTIKSGMMAGLAHPQLAKVLIKIHQAPEQSWSLSAMAEECGMSRSKFADTFKRVIEQTPADYLADWRLSVAKKLILKNQNMDLVANQVGYENGSALARVFRKKIGQAPKEWLLSQQ
ncbi:AraC family transcriptional regulator [Pseudoalteromonas issachenkonii]|uniref:AraC family transcriptional regulator n=1 Tax=Pseudoalteromonas issachenkonii TaxID=152297 RepID=A0ABU9H0S2_9GAMM